MTDTYFTSGVNPDFATLDPVLIGVDNTITNESITLQSSPFSLDSNTGILSINKQVILDRATIGDIDQISQLPNPNLNNEPVIPQLQVGGTMAANDLFLGSNGTTKFISDGTGTYIYNNLSVSGSISNTDLTNKLNAKATTSQFSTLSDTVNGKTDQNYLITNFYNKNQTDSLLQGKANSNNVYSISQVDSALTQKADVISVINKAHASDVYTKTQVDTSLASKANSSDVNTALALKAELANPTFTGTVSGITKAMVGLANVDNTSDASKPVSTATQAALDLKANLASPAFTGTVSGITKAMVGLGSVDNTSDASKPVSTATQAALDLKANVANPIFTGTVSGITKAMVGLANVDNTSDASKPVSTAQQTALNLKANLANPTFTGTVSGITKDMVGLANVDNTSDAGKPVSTAQQTALDLKANLANPTFTGTATAPNVNASTARQVAGANINTIYAPFASPALTGTPTINTYAIATKPWVAGYIWNNGASVNNSGVGMYNATSSRTSAGLYVLTFPTVAPRTGNNLTCIWSPNTSGGFLVAMNNGNTATTATVLIKDNTNTAVDATVSFVICVSP